MPINLTAEKFVYDVGGLITKMPTVAISVNRAPTTNDFAQPGQVWIDKTTDTIYQLASITANSANWTTSPASGLGAFTSVSVNPGDVTLTAGDVVISAGDLSIASGNATIGGNLTVGGVFTITGDLDLTSAQLIDVTSTLNAAPSILLEANGGTSEQIRLYSNQGTATDSVYLLSDVGGITLTATGLASASAIDINALNGGVDLDAALQVNIASSQNAASAIVLSASAGGIDITSAGTAGEDIDISASASINIVSSEGVSDAVNITASNAAGGVNISSGTGNIDVSSTGSFNVTTSGLVSLEAATDTQASPTAASTVNANLGAVTFTGFTTAAAGTQEFTITNSLVTTSTPVSAWAANEGANDAQMFVSRVERAAGSFVVTVTNNGAAALNGNITITFLVIA